MDLETQILFHQNQPDPLPLPKLEPKAKGKVKLKLSPSGELDLEASNLSQNEVRNITDFALLMNADNIMRSRAVQNQIKSSEEVFTHLIVFVLISFFVLSGFYLFSKITTSNQSVSEVISKWQEL